MIITLVYKGFGLNVRQKILAAHDMIQFDFLAMFERILSGWQKSYRIIVMITWYICVLECISISLFLWLNSTPCTDYVIFCLSIQWVIDIWLFLAFGIENSAAMNICAQGFVWIPIFNSLGSRIAGWYDNSIFNLLSTVLFK